MDSEGNQFRLFEFPPSRSRSGGEGGGKEGGERKEVRWKKEDKGERKEEKVRDRLKENEGDVKDRREEEREGRKKESREGREKWGGGQFVFFRVFLCFSQSLFSSRCLISCRFLLIFFSCSSLFLHRLLFLP